jgi:hypothetical protein
MAVLKRLKFAAKSEAFNAEQKSLIEETIDTDLAALALQIEQRAPSKGKGDKQQPKRAALPPELPRTEHRHEPDSTTCRREELIAYGIGRARQRLPFFNEGAVTPAVVVVVEALGRCDARHGRRSLRRVCRCRSNRA